jgi:hypothetical protein
MYKKIVRIIQMLVLVEELGRDERAILRSSRSNVSAAADVKSDWALASAASAAHLRKYFGAA